MRGDDRITGLQKAAILLISLGPEKSALIFKHLKEEEIEELTLEIANTRSVTPQIKENIINEFYEVCLAQQYIAEGGIGYAKELLEKSDYIIGMTANHARNIISMFPEYADKIYAMPSDISDPYGGNLETYRACRDEITECVKSLITALTGDDDG